MKLRTKLLIGSTVLIGVFLAFQFPFSKLIGKRQTVSKSTTHLVEPIREDGSIDYLAALNAFLSDGVTPENNALIPLSVAVGIEGFEEPEHLREHYKSTFFKLLGIEELPPANFLIDPIEFLQKKKPVSDDQLIQRQDLREKLQKKPWDSKTYPLWAEWIKSSRSPLDAIVRASKRPRYFQPLVTSQPYPDGTVLEALLPASQRLRAGARGLCLRAMFYLGHGQVDRAIADLKATRLLAQLSTQSVTLVELLIGTAIIRMAADAEYQLMRHSRTTRQQLADYEQFLAGLKTHVDLATRIDKGERCMHLDIMQRANIHGIWGPSVAVGDEPTTAMFTGLMFFVDWNESMRFSNQAFDNIVEKVSVEKAADRIENLSNYEQTLNNWESELFKPAGMISMIGGPKSRGQWTGKLLSTLLMPAMKQIVSAETEANVRTDLSRVGMALEMFHRDHGSFPTNLDQLRPNYLKSIPRDQFDDQPLRYQRSSTHGFLLYSVGRDHKDDEGISSEDSTKLNQGRSRDERIGHDLAIKIEHNK